HIEEIGKAGAAKVLSMKHDKRGTDAMLIAAAVEQAVKKESAKVVIFAVDIVGKAVAPRIAARLKAGLVAGAIDFPAISGNSFDVKKNVFSGKASAVYTINSDIKIISLLPNSIPVAKNDNKATAEDFTPDLSAV